MTKDERLVSLAVELTHDLHRMRQLVDAFHEAVKADGTDSLAALDYLNLITKNEMCIQVFTNQAQDALSED